MTAIQTNANIDESILREKIIGCWLGKAVGGTLGGPFEGARHTLDLTYYDPVPTEMLPNDDLDFQVVYAYLLDKMDKPRVDRNLLTPVWEHVGMSPDEYGIAKRNLALGLTPPTTGAYDNPFTRGMGAAIRSELWACLAPGDPSAAVRFAYEDACMDHAGEGIYAAQFNAALQSMAFVESDKNVLLDSALKFIPENSELAEAIVNTRNWFAATGDWKKTRQKLDKKYLGDNFTDVIINHAYIVLGWLAGKDFSESICIAVNCGQDTDCTGATLGALLGIIDPGSIDDKWLEPIGRDLVLSDCVTGVEHPKTLDGFTDLVMDLRQRIDTSTPEQSGELQDTAHLEISALLGFVDKMPAGDALPQLPENAKPVKFKGNWVGLEDERMAGFGAAPQDADSRLRHEAGGTPAPLGAAPPVALVQYEFEIDLSRTGILSVNGSQEAGETPALEDADSRLRHEAGGSRRAGTPPDAVLPDTTLPVQLMFASPQPVRVWLDDKLVINSPGGEFVPALHRTRPQACVCTDVVTAGKHKITAAVNGGSGTGIENNNGTLQWVVSLADTNPQPVLRDYLVDPLRKLKY